MNTNNKKTITSLFKPFLLTLSQFFLFPIVHIRIETLRAFIQTLGEWVSTYSESLNKYDLSISYYNNIMYPEKPQLL